MIQCEMVRSLGETSPMSVILLESSRCLYGSRRDRSPLLLRGNNGSIIKCADVHFETTQPANQKSSLPTHTSGTLMFLSFALDLTAFCSLKNKYHMIKSDSGVCGAGVSGEWNFTVYQDRDVELDPAPIVTAVLIVAYIPPEPQAETRDTDGGIAKPRVNCFLVNDHPHNRRHRFSMSVDASDSVLMECVPPPVTPRAFRTGTPGSHAGAHAATTPSRRGPSTRPSQRRLELTSAIAGDGFGASLDPAYGVKSGHKGTALEGARFHRSAEAFPEAGEASVRALQKVVQAHAEESLRTTIELLPPSTNVPLEGADTILLVGSHPNLLEKTTESLKRLLPRAVVLGGVSGCSLVIADRVSTPGKY